MVDTAPHADGELPIHQARRVHMNRGPQLTPRIERFLQIVGQQGVLRFDQAQKWLARLSPEPARMKESGLLTTERTRKLIRPWIDEDVLQYKVFYTRQKGVLWLTGKGIRYAGLHLRYYEPTPSTLAHLFAVNDIRLLIDARRPADVWRSERELRAEQPTSKPDTKRVHLPDAEVLTPSTGTVKAIECELTVKNETYLENVVFDLAANERYNAIWYFLPPPVKGPVARAIGKLPPEHQKRFSLYTLKGEPYKDERKPATTTRH